MLEGCCHGFLLTGIAAKRVYQILVAEFPHLVFVGIDVASRCGLVINEIHLLVYLRQYALLVLFFPKRIYGCHLFEVGIGVH